MSPSNTGAGVVGRVPAEDRHQRRAARASPGRRRARSCARRRRAAGRGRPRPASRCAIATLSVIRASAGAESTTSPPSPVRPAVADLVEVRPGRGRAVRGEVEPGGRGAQRLVLEVGGAADLVARLAGRLVAQRQHRAAREVEHGTILLVDGADAQHGEAGRPAALAHAVLAPRDDLGRRAQRVAEPHRAVQQQPAVEEVGDHAAGGHRGLADRGVPHERRVRQRRPRAEHRVAPACGRARGAAGRRQIAWCTAAWPSVSVSAGAASNSRPTAGPRSRAGRSCGSARARSTRRADTASASSSIRSPSATAPGALGRRALERGERLARLGDLVVGRRERLPQRVELRRVDRPLAVEAERARVRDRGAERRRRRGSPGAGRRSPGCRRRGRRRARVSCAKRQSAGAPARPPSDAARSA